MTIVGFVAERRSVDGAFDGGVTKETAPAEEPVRTACAGEVEASSIENPENQNFERCGEDDSEEGGRKEDASKKSSSEEGP